MINIFKTEPLAINEKGVKFWLDKSTTEYAQNPDINGTVLDVVCYFIEEANGRRSRILVKNGEIIEEDQSLEGIACKIDIRKMLKYGDKNVERSS